MKSHDSLADRSIRTSRANRSSEAPDKTASPCIVVPVKSPELAKQRLSPALNHQQREVLAKHLYQYTLCYLQQHFSDYDLLVVSEDSEVLAKAESLGCIPLRQTEGRGLNAAMEQAASEVCRLGYNSLLMLPIDLAFLTEQELSQVIQRGKDQDVVVAIANDGGTNALLVQPPNGIRFRFGLDSARAHQREAMKANLKFSALALPLMALDIDQEMDLYSATAANSHALAGLTGTDMTDIGGKRYA